ncbi:MAG: GTP 3',8-cyclase MoaA [bacterium]|nr:GTP 3',8-cyclase MoaA [bacterium]
MLKDSFGRVHDYLRISLTDQCNFRCLYCMPNEQMDFLPSSELMSADEVVKLAEIFVSQGISKIRLTGGEPLIRKDIGDIIEQLSKLPVELTLTTNGVLLDKYLDQLLAAGIRSVNISLDTLNAVNFKQLTQRNSFDKVWSNILLMLQNGFHVKVNVVVMRGKNQHEISEFVALTQSMPLHVRFIEFMPFTGNAWEHEQVYTHQEILADVGERFSINKLQDFKHDTAKKYQVEGYMGTFAVISTMSEPFCEDCNRLRLTADGQIKNCLFSADETNLLASLRKGKDVLPVIRHTVMQKKARQGGQFASSYEETLAENITNRSMIKIGG